jgi:hypothetical protein
MRLVDCPGSSCTPLSRVKQVGVCPVCGVRTFLHDKRIQQHQTTSVEMVAAHKQRRRDRRLSHD